MGNIRKKIRYNRAMAKVREAKYAVKKAKENLAKQIRLRKKAEKM